MTTCVTALATNPGAICRHAVGKPRKRRIDRIKVIHNDRIAGDRAGYGERHRDTVVAETFDATASESPAVHNGTIRRFINGNSQFAHSGSHCRDPIALFYAQLTNAGELGLTFRRRRGDKQNRKLSDSEGHHRRIHRASVQPGRPHANIRDGLFAQHSRILECDACAHTL